MRKREREREKERDRKKRKRERERRQQIIKSVTKKCDLMENEQKSVTQGKESDF